MCMLKGHTTFWVINTWQCCCLAWRNVAEGTALKPWDWLGCLGHCHLISVWNAIHSELPEPSCSLGSPAGWWGHKYICDSQEKIVFSSLSIFCILHLCLRLTGALTILVVAVLHQVLVHGVGHLWLAVVPFHIHQQMVPFALKHRHREYEQSSAQRWGLCCLIATSQTGLLPITCCADAQFMTHRVRPKPCREIKSIKKGLWAFTDLIK